MSKKHRTKTAKTTATKGITLVEIASSIFFISVIVILFSELYRTKLLNNFDGNIENVVAFLRQEINLADQLWVDSNGNLHVQNQQSRVRYHWVAVEKRYFLIREIWEKNSWVKRPNVLLPAFSIRAVDDDDDNVLFVQVKEKGVGIQIRKDSDIWMIVEGG